jgi:hypothetical protein
MRYSIMLQLVGFLTLILVGGAALFAWLQSRPDLEQSRHSQENSAVSR